MANTTVTKPDTTVSESAAQPTTTTEPAEKPISEAEKKANQLAAALAAQENLVLIFEPTSEEKNAMELLQIFHKRDELLANGFRQQVKSALAGSVTKNLRERENARRKGNMQDAAKYDAVIDSLYKQQDRL